MGKVVKYTGSKLLGEELRRLRGARGLEDIVAMSKQSPLTSRIHPVSAPSLSQIERGITMPSTEVLYTLSVLYKVSPARLLHLVVEERLAKAHDLPETRDETRYKLYAELTAGRWYEALALAIHGGRLAKSESDRVLWQANHAYALRYLGMRTDAAMMLLECASSPRLAPEHRYIAHLYAADVLAESGFVETALPHAERALAVLPADASPAMLARALRTRVHIVILVHDFELGRDEDALREALRDANRVLELEPDAPPSTRLLIEHYQAKLTQHLGNTLVAARDYAILARRAVELACPLAEMFAELSLGILRRKAGQFVEARRHLERAENRAVELEQFDQAFESYFELYLVAKSLTDGRASHCLKRCLRYWPLVQARTPKVLEFEDLLSKGLVR